MKTVDEILIFIDSEIQKNQKRYEDIMENTGGSITLAAEYGILSAVDAMKAIKKFIYS